MISAGQPGKEQRLSHRSLCALRVRPQPLRARYRPMTRVDSVESQADWCKELILTGALEQTIEGYSRYLDDSHDGLYFSRH